jgi:putative transposase
VETLNVKGMIKNPKLAKHIADANWGEIVRQLKYKADWYGREIIEIDRFFPSSKRCSNCGYINQELKLDMREWQCKECSTNHDRDINASINIRTAGAAGLVCGATGAGIVA